MNGKQFFEPCNVMIRFLSFSHLFSFLSRPMQLYIRLDIQNTCGTITYLPTDITWYVTC